MVDLLVAENRLVVPYEELLKDLVHEPAVLAFSPSYDHSQQIWCPACFIIYLSRPIRLHSIHVDASAPLQDGLSLCGQFVPLGSSSNRSICI